MADLVPRAAGDRCWRWLTIAPALLVLFGLTLLPIADLVRMSLHDITWSGGVARWRWVGGANYAALAGDQLFAAGILNTVIFAVVGVSLQMVLGFALALFTSKLARGQTVYRTIFLLPILVPGIVIGAIWKLMYNVDFGVINQLAGVLGIAPHDWLGDPATALLSVIVVNIWHWTPFCYLLLLAGLESLPRDVYEAATVDGASAWQELRHVTLPMMLPTIVVTLVFRLIIAFKVFDEVYLLTGGGPGTATEVVSFSIYRRFFTEDRVGYGSALSIVTLFIMALVVIVAIGAARRRQAGAA
ncbi:sugar ABC transporter permease [Vineibacter terrae]|uniref:carbohydrate ABC transporter permease n=1 Tax=Vineibacter terrae TaxID=2586908 RepID=UPI002E337661|nr:sugar ABC transporter permease [Vineibacter terrae]HEX2885193.1 sugar ABC transporter permease [Vineibacter terrae]